MNQFEKYIWKMIDAEDEGFISFSANRELVFYQDQVMS